MKGGAVDFLTKPVDPPALLAAIDAALARDRSLRSRRSQADGVRERFETLTARERSVLEHVVAGRLNKQTAGALGITERTVKMHRAQVMAKMQVGSVAELVQVVGRLAEAGLRTVDGEGAAGRKLGER
jgi:FixJ family two-component response regulator